MSVITVNTKAGIHDYVTVKDAPYQGIIDLSNRQKKLKVNSNNSSSRADKDENERDSAVDKGNQCDMVTKENVDKEKSDAWCNLRYTVIKPTSIKHKLPLMPPPERGRSKLALIKKIKNESDKQRKDVFDVESQTDRVYFVTKEDYELIQYIKDNAITKEAITNLIYYNDDVNNNMVIQSDLEQESASHPEAVPVPECKSGEEEQKFHNLEHYSEETKAKLNSIFGSTDKKKSDHFTGTNFKTKNHFFEFIINSMWQLVICMNRHRDMVENKEEKIKSGVDQFTQTSPEIAKSKKFNSKVTQTANLEEIAMSQLSSGVPILEKRDVLDQRMHVIHSYYCNPPIPTAARPSDHRELNQQSIAENQLQKQRKKKQRLNSPDTHKERETTILNQMQTTGSHSPRWQFGKSNQFGGDTIRAVSQRLQRYHSDMAKTEWFGVMPPPPPPPRYYRHEHRFTSQQTSSATSQYQCPSQQQEMLEYQKYQQMEMQKKAWESQLQNYPNSAWSYPVQEN